MSLSLFEIPFTQYILPNGAPRPITWRCTSEDQAAKAQEIVAKGGIFEAEVLQTGVVSFTVERDGKDGEREELAHELCSNDSNVIASVEALVERAYNSLV